MKSNRQVEIYKTETETNLRSNRIYINNDDKNFGKKSQKNLNYIPIIESE